MPGTRRRSPSSLWACAYMIVPSQAETQLNTIRTIVDRENSAAKDGARTWTGRLVLERRVTHILIVSDRPEQDREINRLLEAELKRLDLEFFLTKPLAIADDLEGITAPESNGNGNGNGNGR